MSPSPAHLLATAALCAALLAFTGATTAAGEKLETVISIKKPPKLVKSIEASALVDPLFKLYPELRANLVAEARREIAKWLAQLDDAMHTNPEGFGNGQMMSLDYSYRFRSKTGRYVSVMRNQSECGGGAHCNGYDDTILWDTIAGKRANIRSLFLETEPGGPTMTALAELARTEVVLAVDNVGRDFYSPQKLAERRELFPEIEPDLLNIGPISLAPSNLASKSSGLTFHYSTQLLRSYDAPNRMFVPWTSFASLLSAEGKQLFGGERPKSDLDDKQ